MTIIFLCSQELLADEVYADEKTTTEKVVDSSETSVLVKIVDCKGKGSTPCTASVSTTVTKKTTSFETAP